MFKSTEFTSNFVSHCDFTCSNEYFSGYIYNMHNAYRMVTTREEKQHYILKC